MRLGLWALVACGGCGRVGFEEARPVDGGDDDAATSDAMPDAMEVPFTEAAGVLDDAFGIAGKTGLSSPAQGGVALYSHLYRPGGGTISVGVRGHSGGNTTADFMVLGLDANGQPDPAFGPTGIRSSGPTMYDYAYAIARVSDTRYAVAGDGDDQVGTTLDDITVGMVDGGGGIDPTFGASGFVRVDVGTQRDTGKAIALVGGSLVVCGTANYDSLDSHFVLLRLDLSGARVAAFGTNGLVVDDFATGVNDECSAVTARPGGGVYAVGYSNDRILIAAYDDAGARVTAFGTNGFVTLGASGSFAYDVLVDRDGDIIVVGEDNGGSIVVKLAPDGTLRSTFGVNGIAAFVLQADLLASVVEQPNGKLVASGFRGNTGVVVRFDRASGALDSAFGNLGAAQIVMGTSHVELLSVDLEPGGKLLVAGRVGDADPFSALVARFE